MSCKSKNYISYYNKINSIDSIYSINHDTLALIKQYKKVFRKFRIPHSSGSFRKYEVYISLSDKYNLDFGKKKNLYKLLNLVAPYSDHYKTLLPLYEKYGIDSLSVEKKIAKSKESMNKRLVDSFSLAFVRDQYGGRSDSLVMVKNDLKNARLLKWTIENYGYPSPKKIGVFGNDGVFMPMRTFLSHMSSVPDYYPYFRDSLLKFVKSGECLPEEYATMVDRNERDNNRELIYDQYFGNFTDTLEVNRNRRSIGLKSLLYQVNNPDFQSLKK
jgi:hypothetical protein